MTLLLPLKASMEHICVPGTHLCAYFPSIPIAESYSRALFQGCHRSFQGMFHTSFKSLEVPEKIFEESVCRYLWLIVIIDHYHYHYHCCLCHYCYYHYYYYLLLLICYLFLSFVFFIVWLFITCYIYIYILLFSQIQFLGPTTTPPRPHHSYARWTISRPMAMPATAVRGLVPRCCEWGFLWCNKYCGWLRNPAPPKGWLKSYE
jgi:hypothetical protein